MKKETLKKEIGWLLKEKYFGKENSQFKKDIERLTAGEPLAYVIGFVDFLGCRIDLSKKPLIPRTETEYWVQKAIEKMSYDSDGRRNRSIEVLDIFSGSGCIGISVMRHIKNTKVVFAEKDKHLLQQIKINCRINNIRQKNRYKIIQSDIFNNVKGKYDIIFANPPYISTNSKNNLQKSVLQYEPHIALFGKRDGLFYIRKFLVEAQYFLHPKGIIYMEFDVSQKSAIEKLLKKYQYKTWQFGKDQYNKWRYVRIHVGI